MQVKTTTNEQVQLFRGCERDDAASMRIYAIRELAALDVAAGTDSTGLVLEMCRKFPAEAGQYVNAYAAAIRRAQTAGAR
jgi:hypothetical protein